MLQAPSDIYGKKFQIESSSENDNPLAIASFLYCTISPYVGSGSFPPLLLNHGQAVVDEINAKRKAKAPIGCNILQRI